MSDTVMSTTDRMKQARHFHSEKEGEVLRAFSLCSSLYLKIQDTELRMGFWEFFLLYVINPSPVILDRSTR